MLTVCGFAASHPHNKAKLALLEKGVSFGEGLARVGETDRSATQIIDGRDFLAELPICDCLKRLRERPTVQRVNDDRKANTVLMMQRAKAASKL